MKLRIKDNSLRLRLSQSEVDSLRSDKQVDAVIHFPGSTHMRYSLVWGDNEQFNAYFDGTSMTAQIPRAAGEKWFNPTEISLEHKITLPDSSELKLLIEKDFQCLTERPDEDESDLFPNPNSHC